MSDPLNKLRQAALTTHVDESQRRDLLNQALIFAEEVRRMYSKERARADELEQALERMHAVEKDLQESLAMLRKTDEHRRDLLKALVEAEEIERKRIAEDIHDDSIQVMAAVGLRLHTVKQRLIDQASIELFERLERSVEDTMHRLRVLIFRLRPPSLDESGLTAAIDEYLRFTAEDQDPDFEVTVDLEREPPEEVRTVLYRIFQEVLTNVRKHARASRVEIRVGEDSEHVRLSVRDDGQGFSLGNLQRARPGHLGLASIRERAETAGGGIRIESAPGEGTLIECWISTRRHDAPSPG